MIKKEDYLPKKICSFYVSDWHLITMLLPYITNKIDEGAKIGTTLEKSINENVEILLSKTNLSKETQEKLKSINWYDNNLIKYYDLEKYLNNIILYNKEIYILVNGNNTYIQAINENFDKWLEKHKTKLIKNRIKLNIINFFEVMQFNNNIDNILDMHDLILNTSGEKEIEEVFEGYKRKNNKIVN